MEGVDTNKYDEANLLVLPSKKRDTKIKRLPQEKKEKYLSRKQRKKLEKIVERREKKSNRAELVEELQKYQLPSTTYDALTPLVRVQTEGVRNINLETLTNESNSKPKTSGPSRSGWKKSGAIVANKQKFLSWSRRFSGKASLASNSNVLGFEKSSEEDSSEEEEEEENKDEINREANGDAVVRSEETSSVEVHNVHEADFDQSTPEADRSTVVPVPIPDAALSGQLSDDSKQIGKRKLKGLELRTNAKKKAVEAAGSAITAARKTRKIVHVVRTDEINAVRSKLPIIAEEQVIMEQITENLAVVLAGETGCGKTTQVPQFLYEAGYASEGKIIGIM